MRKLLFTSLIDAVLNRVGSVFSNIFLRRLAAHAAATEAMDLAAIEERIASLRADGCDFAADRLEAYLHEAKGDDPSFVAATSFGRQLLADDYELDTPRLRGEPGDEQSSSKAHSNRRRTRSARSGESAS